MQTVGLNRNTIDKYYTKPSIVELCIKELQRHITINKNDLIIEPSAGNGAFIDAIKQISPNNMFYDLEPEHPEIHKQDFLSYTHNSSDIITHVIGNPPFGRQSSMAIKFIKKSSSFCNTISFILPKSFKKTSMQKNFPPSFHLIYELELPDKSFIVSGRDYNVPCIFQIWEKRMIPRQIERILVPKNYEFVKKTDSPHISFRRVGVNAGKIDVVIENKSEQSHYFIKFLNDCSTEENIVKMKELSFHHNNTVGPKSIGKQELIKEMNSVF